MVEISPEEALELASQGISVLFDIDSEELRFHNFLMGAHPENLESDSKVLVVTLNSYFLADFSEVEAKVAEYVKNGLEHP